MNAWIRSLHGETASRAHKGSRTTPGCLIGRSSGGSASVSPTSGPTRTRSAWRPVPPRAPTSSATTSPRSGPTTSSRCRTGSASRSSIRARGRRRRRQQSGRSRFARSVCPLRAPWWTRSRTPIAALASRLNEAILARIEALLPLYAIPGRAPTRSDVLRAVMLSRGRGITGGAAYEPPILTARRAVKHRPRPVIREREGRRAALGVWRSARGSASTHSVRAPPPG